MVVSGGGSTKYLAAAEFVKKADNRFSSFNGETSVNSGKNLCCPLGDNSPHMGYWTNTSMGVSSFPL
jgi:hypothetical protein